VEFFPYDEFKGLNLYGREVGLKFLFSGDFFCFALLNQFAKSTPGGLVVMESMPTQQEIAIMVNISRETVSRAIQILLQKGVMEKDLRRLIVRQPEEPSKAVKQVISPYE
jgi:hypothetical protein